MASRALATRALDGLTVLEVSSGVAGAYCGKLFSLYGARVLLLEPPGGSRLRHFGPFASTAIPAESGALFMTLGAGKESLVVDLESSSGRRTLERLSRSADVLVTDEAAWLEAIGITYETLAGWSPRLVMVSVSPFGESGPYKDFSATSATLYAMGGYTYSTGDADREPLEGPEHQPEYVGGANAYTAALAGVIARGRTGRGQRIEVSEVEGLVAGHQWTLTRYAYNGRVQERNGNRYNSLHPVTFYDCADGSVAASPSAPAQLRSMLQLMEREDLLADQRFATNAARMDNADAFDAEVQPWFRARTRADVVELCQAYRVPCAAVAEVDELLEHEQLVARGYWQAVSHPVAGTFRAPGLPFRLPDSPVEITRAPLLGEHSDKVGRRPGASAGFDGAIASTSRQEAVAQGGALAGLRVLDLTRVWSGPLATRILGDMGAEVIKIEHPLARGPAQPLPVHPSNGSFFPGDVPGDDPWNRNAAFNKLNRNKLSLTLDLAKPQALQVFSGLVKIADVVIENYSPRVMGNLGLGFDALAALNPRIIMVSMPGYGLDGPLRDRVAYGTTLDGESGIASLMGYEDSGPRRPGVAFPDHVAAVHATGALLTALLQRGRTGRGQHVDLSQLESMVTFVGDQVVGFQFSGERPRRQGNRHRWMAPSGAYPCREPGTWISIAVSTDQQWAAMAETMGRPRLASDSRFAAATARTDHQDELDGIVAEWTARQGAHQAMLALQSVGIAAGEVLSAKGMHEDPHLRARGFFVALDHASAGRHDYPGLPMRFSETPPVFRSDAPCLGEHNRTVLRDMLGYDDEAIERLAGAGVIVDRPPI